jgi:hypothetical protein
MCGISSGSLRSESVEGQPSGFLPGSNHALDRHETGHITGERDSGMNKKIRVANSGMVMQRVSTARALMMRLNADATQ